MHQVIEEAAKRHRRRIKRQAILTAYSDRMYQALRQLVEQPANRLAARELLMDIEHDIEEIK